MTYITSLNSAGSLQLPDGERERAQPAAATAGPQRLAAARAAARQARRHQGVVRVGGAGAVWGWWGTWLI